jgi:hypothetical protein
MNNIPCTSVRRVRNSRTFPFKAIVFLCLSICGLFFGCTVAPPKEPPTDTPLPMPTPVDIWVEIDYSSSYNAAAPTWTFSDTPGWGAIDWAWTGTSYPEARDTYNNIMVEEDPIGRCAILGSSASLDLVIGLKKLSTYSSAGVRIEGRSASSSASVIIDVYNPLNSIGTSVSLGNEWTVHVLDLDLGEAVAIGEDQAMRVEPKGGSGSLALVRMRLTIHDATW